MTVRLLRLVRKELFHEFLVIQNGAKALATAGLRGSGSVELAADIRIQFERLSEIRQGGSFVAQFVIHDAKIHLGLRAGHVARDFGGGVASFLTLPRGTEFAHPLLVEHAEIDVEQAAEFGNWRGAVVNINVDRAGRY